MAAMSSRREVLLEEDFTGARLVIPAGVLAQVWCARREGAVVVTSDVDDLRHLDRFVELHQI
jgi:hypothetical protein